MRNATIWILLVLAGSVIGGVVYLRAQQTASATLGQLTATPPNFVYKTTTYVTFTIRIETPTSPTRVDLQRFDYPGGTPIATVRPRVVAQLHDDGQAGDALAGDNVFTAIVPFNEPSPGRLYFRVAIAFPVIAPSSYSGRIFVDVDSVPLPPDPGEAGKQTLEGIDADRDGVRDDVQRYIAQLFPSDQASRGALTQYATSVTDLLVKAGDVVSSRDQWTHILDANNCLTRVLGDASTKTRLLLRARILNTPNRSRAFLQASQSPPTSSFQEIGAPATSTCKSQF
jgi:hypothetical protein